MWEGGGRAGRDGGQADCILYYAYKDKKTLEHMMTEGKDKWDPVVKRDKDELYKCVEYCENKFLCRRAIQIEHFGEKFDRVMCNKTCDNCRSDTRSEQHDFTNVAKDVITLVKDLQIGKSNGSKNVTKNQLVDLF